MTAPDLATPLYRVNGSEKTTAIWVEDTLTDKRVCTVTPGEDDADRAALIVRAVNSHAALVAAASEALDWMVKAGYDDGAAGHMLRAALALARQK